jgi:two-component system phosphate regulon sensor histidine kinase PhoR
VIDASGRVLGDSALDGEALRAQQNQGGLPEVAAALSGGEGRAVRRDAAAPGGLLHVALPIDLIDPGRGVVRLAVPLTAVREARRRILTPILLAVGLTVAAAAVLGSLAARRTARRLEAMSRTASALAAGHLEARAGTTGRDEIALLARSINRMAVQLEERLGLLARERNQLRTILDGTVEGVVLTDRDGRILLANDAFARIFGARPPLEGRRPLEVARVPALQEAIDAALAATTPVTREIALPGGDTEKVLHASLAAVREPGGGAAGRPGGTGETVGSVAVFHDVTELKRLERVRREFVANVSHELRTPLTAIKGYAETLRDAAPSDPQQVARFADVIHRHAERLRGLIEELLDLAAIEQGQARLTLAPVRVQEVAAQAESAVRPAADRRRHALNVAVPADLPPVLADRDRLAQVLINLLDNAVKFTPDGGRVGLAASAGGGRIVLAVSDNGVGIPQEEIGRIFERFYRVDRSRDRREGGTGLGLAIAKHLTQAMGGNIEVESAPGAGTTFRITLRAA